MKIKYLEKLVGSFPINHKHRLFFGKRPEFVLDEPFSCITEYDDGSCEEIMLPVGFKTDGASIPRIFWFIENPFGQSLHAAVIHDFEYNTKFGTRLEADDRFFAGMGELEVVEWKRNAMYLAVRIFGYLVWRFKKYED